MSFVPNIKGDQILETIMTADLTNPLRKPVRFAENLLGAEVVLSVAYQLESGSSTSARLFAGFFRSVETYVDARGTAS